MKKIIYLIVLWGLTFTINAQDGIKYLDLNAVLVPNQIVYVFGDNVKFRDNSSTDANVLEKLHIGAELKIIEKTGVTYLYNGINWPWYKVAYNNKEGYMIGGLISLDKKIINNSMYLISLKKVNDDYHIITRVVNEEGKKYLENSSRFGTESLFSLEVFDNRGLENINNMAFINYHVESCGANDGGYYLFNDGISLIKAIDVSSVGDAGDWFVEEVVFPNQKGGKKGKILYSREKGEVVDETNNHTKAVVETCEFVWKGKLLELKQ